MRLCDLMRQQDPCNSIFPLIQMGVYCWPISLIMIYEVIQPCGTGFPSAVALGLFAYLSDDN